MKERYIVDDKGKKTAVVLDLRDYERLLEDNHGLRVVAERREESAVGLEELKAKLRADGLFRPSGTFLASIPGTGAADVLKGKLGG